MLYNSLQLFTVQKNFYNSLQFCLAKTSTDLMQKPMILSSYLMHNLQIASADLMQNVDF